VVVGIRPEALQAVGDAPAAGGGRVLTGTVVKRESLGSDVLAFMDLSPAKTVGKESLALFGERPGDSSTTRPAGWIVARLPADSPVTEAQRLGVTVATNSLHLFDPATGVAWARTRPGAPEPELPSSAPAGQGSDRAG
jgi:ABC-type sugar transport system ATPase subunit